MKKWMRVDEYDICNIMTQQLGKIGVDKENGWPILEGTPRKSVWVKI